MFKNSGKTERLTSFRHQKRYACQDEWIIYYLFCKIETIEGNLLIRVIG